MRPLAVVLAVLLLAGCAAHTVTQQVPVPVPCKVPEVARPVLPIDTVPADADLFAIVRALWASLEVWEGYERELQAAIAACQ